MQKVWNFSTLQRPTQEEKERRRKFRDFPGGMLDDYPSLQPTSPQMSHLHHQPPAPAAVPPTTTKKSSKVGRSKTFRYPSSSESNLLAAHAAHQQQQLLMLMEHHQRTLQKKNRSKSANRNENNRFVSRLRFLDHGGVGVEASSKLRWQDREPFHNNNNSSGYSSGGQSKDENIYGDSTYG